MTKDKDEKKERKYTQGDLLIDFFKKNPNEDMPHPKVVDYVTDEWKKQTGKVFRDPDRGIRKLHQEGMLKKVKKGVYRFDPSSIKNKNLEDFSPKQKKEILKRDGYKCVLCGHGEKEGVELHVDHIKPKDHDGKATIENGQTLCAQHNFMKKKAKQTETGKKMFIQLYKLAKKEKNKELQNFCADILETYKNHDINGHIEWKK